MSNSIVLKTTLTSGVVIREDEKTGMYDVTEMFDSYNSLKMSQTPVSADGSSNEFKKRRVENWLALSGTKELIEKCSTIVFGETYERKESYDSRMKRLFLKKAGVVDGCGINIKLPHSKYIYDAGNIRLKVLIEFDGGCHSIVDDGVKNKVASDNGFLVFRISIEPQIDLVIDVLTRMDKGETFTNEKFNKEKLKFIKTCKSVFSTSEKDTENQQLTKEQKKTIENQVIKTTKSRNTKDGWIKGKTMACPILALDAACYLDVDTKYDVYNYYLDGKINERRKVKEQYKLMCEALYTLSKEQSIFPYAVQQINSIVFDRGIGGLWNDETTKEQLQETYKIMVMITELIEDGYIDTLSKLRKKFNSMYVKKYGEHKFEPCVTVE